MVRVSATVEGRICASCELSEVLGTGSMFRASSLAAPTEMRPTAYACLPSGVKEKRKKRGKGAGEKHQNVKVQELCWLLLGVVPIEDPGLCSRILYSHGSFTA